MRLSVAIPRKVTAKLETRMTIVNSGTLAAFTGTMPVARMPAALTTFAIAYHFLRLSVASTSGAHANFQVCGMMPTATSAATCATGMPAFEYK